MIVFLQCPNCNRRGALRFQGWQAPQQILPNKDIVIGTMELSGFDPVDELDGGIFELAEYFTADIVSHFIYHFFDIQFSIFIILLLYSFKFCNYFYRLLLLIIIFVIIVSNDLD